MSINSIVRFLSYLRCKFLTKTRRTAGISETSEKKPGKDVRKAAIISTKDFPVRREIEQVEPEPEALLAVQAKECPYCKSKDIVRRGWRKKKYEKAQLYLCNQCKKTFTSQRVKGKSFPLRVIFEGLSTYNLGYSIEETCQRLKEEFGLNVTASTLNEWVKEFSPLCRYSRLRPYALKLFSPAQIVQTVHLYHHQVYDFSVHRAKLALLLQEYRNNKFDPLREFLEAIQSECPHQFFKEGVRASEIKVSFSREEVMIKEKQNFATRIADLALQAVPDNKLRHRTLQNFMLANDSVTVAVEVPVYMDEMDVEHMQDELGFKIPLKLDKVLTGHIDILQLRNGAVHILDYKPNSAKGKEGSAAFTQLALYALMLSRLTGLRLYDFKCAWFDENSYFEFFPLHVVYKLRDRARKEHPDQMKLELENALQTDI